MSHPRRTADPADAADLAVNVKDEWQGRGVATALLEVLVEKVARFTIGEPELALNNVLRGLASLPVRVTA